MKYRTDDLRINEMKEVSPPSQVHSEFRKRDMKFRVHQEECGPYKCDCHTLWTPRNCRQQ